jgi:hypothetical protein
LLQTVASGPTLSPPSTAAHDTRRGYSKLECVIFNSCDGTRWYNGNIEISVSQFTPRRWSYVLSITPTNKHVVLMLSYVNACVGIATLPQIFRSNADNVPQPLVGGTLAEERDATCQ